MRENADQNKSKYGHISRSDLFFYHDDGYVIDIMKSQS